MSFNIKGLENLESVFEGLAKKVQNEITENALKAGAKPIEEEQIRLVPVDTGELRDSIKITPVKKKKGQAVIHIGVPKEAGRHNVEKAWFQNNGFKSRGGLFFMEQSFENANDEALENIANAIKERLVK